MTLDNLTHDIFLGILICGLITLICKVAAGFKKQRLLQGRGDKPKHDGLQ